MAYESIEFEKSDGIALLKLNRPKVLNSLNAQLMDEMRSALAEVSGSDAVRALVVTGNGRGFCAGADLGGGERKPGVSLGEAVAQSMEERFNPLVRDLFHLNKPWVAAVNGTTAGGGVGIALSADIAIAARSATFKLVFVPRLGIIPDCGASFFLQRAIGRARALGMSMLGESLPAEQAAEWGLVWSCVDDDKLMGEAMAVAARLAPRWPFLSCDEPWPQPSITRSTSSSTSSATRSAFSATARTSSKARWPSCTSESRGSRDASRPVRPRR